MRSRSGYLDSYCKTLHRVYWVEFIDNQLNPGGGRRFRASLVGDPLVSVGAAAWPQDSRPEAEAQQRHWAA